MQRLRLNEWVVPVEQLAHYTAVMRRNLCLHMITFTRTRIHRVEIEKLVAKHVSSQQGIVAIRPFHAFASRMGMKMARKICMQFMIDVILPEDTDDEDDPRPEGPI